MPRSRSYSFTVALRVVVSLPGELAPMTRMGRGDIPAPLAKSRRRPRRAGDASRGCGSGGVGADAVAAFRLGAVECPIGSAIEFVRIEVVAPLRQTDRRGDRNRPGALVDRELLPLDREPGALGDP